MIEIRVRDYPTRESLENHINRLPSGGEYIIVGTEDELRVFNLSHHSNVWGIPCKASDYQPPAVAIETPDRGQRFPSGISGREQMR